MEITDVRVKRVETRGERGEKLLAFCSFTVDGQFVVADVRPIEGPQGPFIAMPSRRVTDRCGQCGGKNHLRAKFCNDCGGKLGEDRAPKDANGRVKLFVDVAHPINAECRERIQKAVLAAYADTAGGSPKSAGGRAASAGSASGETESPGEELFS